MKLQNLIIIFLAIALPVIIILSVYVNYQVDTAALRERYNDALLNAAHETIAAFQINTTNDEYSDVADSKMRDIQAALNTFGETLATEVGASGSSRSIMMAYVPALVFTLYDGYYIYSPTERIWEVDQIQDEETGLIEYEKDWKPVDLVHELKSYVHYTKQYTNAGKTKILNVNFTLDNFLSVYYYESGKEFQSRAGYLEVVPEERDRERFLTSLGPDDDGHIRKYYEEAWEFTEWFNKQLSESGLQDAKEALMITEANQALPDIPSYFNDEKHEVIRKSITDNLIQAMSVYGNEMPELNATDWDLVLNNVCLIAFMQGIPTGTTVYNNYTIAVSTENKEIVRGSDIYFIGEGVDADQYYHRIWCPHLKGDKITGYNKTDFKNQESAGHRDTLACYYCMVNASDATWEHAATLFASQNKAPDYIRLRKNAYDVALAREKIKLVPLKHSGFISGSKPATGGDW